MAASVSTIVNIVNQSGIEDQNDISFGVISQQLNRIADQNFSLDGQVWE